MRTQAIIGPKHASATAAAGVLLAAITIAGCGDTFRRTDAECCQQLHELRSQLTAKSPADRQRFVNVAEEAGLIDPLKGMYIHAGAWGDLTGDGYPDLFVGSFAERSRPEAFNHRGHTDGPSPNRLLLNHSGLRFHESPQPAINVHATTSGAAFADFDNSGHLDLIVMNMRRTDDPDRPRSEPNRLYRNQGDGTFIDVTDSSGLAIDAPFGGRTALIADFDGDGLLDMLLQEDPFREPYNSYLMRNTGNFRFEDVTEQAGLPANLVGLGGAIGDVTGDSWPDLLVVGVIETVIPREGRAPRITTEFANRLYLNNGDGTFREASNDVFNAHWPRGVLQNPTVAGAAMGDLTGDGRLDIVIGHHYNDTYRGDALVGVRIYLNRGDDENGDPLFEDVTDEAGSPAIFNKQPQVAIADFNNSGRMDILTSAMMTVDGEFQPYILTNTGLNANGVPQFEAPPGTEPMRYTGWIPGSNDTHDPRYVAVAPVVDYNRNGKLDVFYGEWWPERASQLYRNVWAQDTYLAVTLQNDSAPAAMRWNRNGIGATVRVYEAGRAGEPDALLGTVVIHVSNGYSSSTEAAAHFGLPGRRRVDVVATLPNAQGELIRRNVAVNQRITLTETTDRAR